MADEKDTTFNRTGIIILSTIFLLNIVIIVAIVEDDSDIILNKVLDDICEQKNTNLSYHEESGYKGYGKSYIFQCKNKNNGKIINLTKKYNNTI